MRPQKKRSKKPIIIGVIIVVLLTSGAVFFWSKSGNQGQVTDDTGALQAKKQLPPYLTYDGTYIIFQYKSVYDLHRQPAQAPDLEIATLSANTDYEKHLAVSVSQLPGGNLNNNSAYNLRKTDTEHYTSRLLDVNGSQITIWVKRDGFEQTAIIPHGDKVAVLSFATAGTVDANLTSEVNLVLDSLSWKG